MHFEELVRDVDASVRLNVTIDRFEEPHANQASWQRRARSAAIAVVPPRNVSVTLSGPADAPATMWYPIDPALVGVISRRIAGYLGGA